MVILIDDDEATLISASPNSPTKGNDVPNQHALERTISFKKSKKRPGLTRSSSVRFHREKEVYEEKRPHDIEPSELWYSNTDFQDFRENHMQDAKKLAKATKTRNKAILKAFEKCYEEEKTPSDKLMERLSEFFEDYDCNGMERFTSKSLFKDKKNRRSQIYDILHEIQNYEFNDEELRAGLLRVACERISKPSVLMANSLARARSCRF